MKKFYGLLAVLLMGVLLLGCAPEAPVSTLTADTAPILSDGEIYDRARAQLLAAPNQILNYTLTCVRTVQGQEYTEKVTGNISLSGIGSGALDALVKESLTYGTLKAEHSLTYCDGAAYSQISGCTFTQAMTEEDFVSRQLPAALLDRPLYQAMEVEATQDGTVYRFTGPSALENWVTDGTDAQLTDAAGTATLNTAGLLVASTYRASYTRGSASYQLTVELRSSAPATLDLSAVHPEHQENAVPLACLEAPKMLLQAAGDIFTAQAMACTISETIYSQAIPLVRTRQSTASLSGTGENLVAALTNHFQTATDRGQSTASSQDYRFAQGICTVSVDGGEATVQEGVTWESMRTAVEDAILSGLFATRYLAGAELTENEDAYVLQFSGNDAYCTDLCGDIGSFLKIDFDSLASSYETTQAAGYLTVNKQTGLPVAMGMSFSRTHIFAEEPNTLSYNLEQVLSLSAE